eukprot:TRINITY_DN33058_c0_g1_i1.p1 TRINITY_DN33058_c0_g1~~TRINITY_DN33058_c0_g1_i1.p1  ORF type:complete len:744 (+),score=249.17 TRINITY_DN33058_c0_g1_i1:56-2287(+)
MGAGGSAQLVQEHLDKQDACIKKIHAALESGAAGPGAPVSAFIDGEPAECHSDDSDIEDELQLGRYVLNEHSKRKTYVPEKDDEDEKDVEWKEITDEERRNELSYSRPWLLNTLPPTNWEYNVTDRDKAPSVKLTLEHVYGYRTRGSRNTLYWVGDKRIMYTAASVGIVHDLAEGKQAFCQDHSSTITALAFHKGRNLAATGQATVCTISVWDALTQKSLAKLGGYHKTAVCALEFAHSGDLLVSLGMDEHNSIGVYDWQQGCKVACFETGYRRILELKFVPNSDSEFVAVGQKTLTRFAIGKDGCDYSLKPAQKGQLGKRGRNQAFLCAGFLGPDVVVGTAGGEIYRFDSDFKLAEICYAHSGHVTSMTQHGDLLVTGGMDGWVNVWDAKFTRVSSISMCSKGSRVRASGVRALDCRGDQLLVGCMDSSITSVDLTDKSKCALARYHCGEIGSNGFYGEMWGLCEDPNGPRFATASDDGILRVWDSKSHVCVHEAPIAGEGIGDYARVLEWSTDGRWLSVGFQRGYVALFDTQMGFSEFLRIRSGRRRVSVLKFSPDSKYLAVANGEHTVTIYEAEPMTMREVGVIKYTSVCVSVDWSKDGQHVRCSAQDWNLKYYAVPSGEEVPAVEMRDTEWASSTTLLGWNVQGIWPGDVASGQEINVATRSHNGRWLASDAVSELRLFRYPCVGSGLDATGQLPRRPQRVHEPSQTNTTGVRWHSGDTHVLTIGGADNTIFQWKVDEA